MFPQPNLSFKKIILYLYVLVKRVIISKNILTLVFIYDNIYNRDINNSAIAKSDMNPANLRRDIMEFKIRFYSFFAFLTNRRKHLWLSFYPKISNKIWLAIFKLFFSKNIIITLKENKTKTKVRTDIFLFRNPKNAKKFKQAQKLSWKENEDEKNRLYGEALEYPEFAISDFSELLKERKKDNSGKTKVGDRLSFSCIEYGYEGFVFKPENLSKIIDWYKEQKLPQRNVKIKIYNHRIKKWQSLSKNEIKEILNSKNPLKISEKIAKNRE